MAAHGIQGRPRSLAGSLVLWILSVYSLPAAAQEMVEVTSFGADPGNLRMFLHTPATIRNDTVHHPLVVVLHGCGQSAGSFAEQSGWNTMADQSGFHVIYPQQRTSNNVTHCFNWFEEEDITRGSGEVASIAAMVDHAQRVLHIDSTRIFVIGVSAGAAMAVALGACYPEVFSHVASFAGGPYKCALGPGEALRVMRDPSPRSPSEWKALVRTSGAEPDRSAFPKMLILHGLSDHTVDPRNALGLVDQWTAVHGIDNDPDSVDIPSAEERVEQRIYNDANGVTKVTLLLFSGLGHEYPIDRGLGPTRGGRFGTFTKDIGVHGTYLIAREFGLVR